MWKLLFAIITVAGLFAAAPIRVSWNTGNAHLKRAPTVSTEGLTRAGTVDLIVDLATDGTVKRVASSVGPEDLRERVTASLKTCQFAGPDIPESAHIIVYFVAGAGPPMPSPPPFGRTLAELRFSYVSESDQSAVIRGIGVRAGQILTDEKFGSASRAVRAINPELQLMLTLHAGQPVLVVTGRSQGPSR
jgi:hypothetical protein